MKGIRVVLLLITMLLALSAVSTVFAADTILTDLDQVAEVAPQTPVEERIVVIYDQASDNNVRKLGLTTDQVESGESVSSQVDVLTAAPQQDTDALVSEIQNRDGVLTAGRDAVVETQGQALPDDSFFLESSHSWYSVVQGGFTWRALSSKAAVKVAVIDTGCLTDHTDLKDRCETTINKTTAADQAGITTDLSGHGTAVCGVIAANTNNGIGTAGIAGLSNVTVVPYRCGGTTEGDRNLSVSAIAASLIDIAENRSDIQIINMSFSILDDGTDSHTRAIELMREPVSKAVKAGKILVAAAGNDGAATEYAYPSSFVGVISAAAVDQNLNAASFSNKNDKIDITAPGVNIPSTDMNGSCSYWNGTSFSSPIVAGACALILTADSTLTAAQTEAILKSTAMDLGDTGVDSTYGSGLVQINSAVRQAAGLSGQIGSVSGNQTVSTADALQALRHSVREIELSDDSFTRADVTHDRVVNADDALQILRYSVAEISRFE